MKGATEITQKARLVNLFLSKEYKVKSPFKGEAYLVKKNNYHFLLAESGEMIKVVSKSDFMESDYEDSIYKEHASENQDVIRIWGVWSSLFGYVEKEIEDVYFKNFPTEISLKLEICMHENGVRWCEQSELRKVFSDTQSKTELRKFCEKIAKKLKPKDLGDPEVEYNNFTHFMSEYFQTIHS